MGETSGSSGAIDREVIQRTQPAEAPDIDDVLDLSTDGDISLTLENNPEFFTTGIVEYV